MAALVGSWEFSAAENLDGYMQAAGKIFISLLLCSHTHNDALSPLDLSGRYPWPEYGAPCVRPFLISSDLICFI